MTNIVATGISSKLTSSEKAIIRTNIDTDKSIRDYNVYIDSIFAKATVDLNFVKNEHKVYEAAGHELKQLSSILSSSQSITTTYNSPYGVNTAAIGVPRIEYDPETGQPLGLLTEETRTNLLLRSQEFDNAVWTKRSGSAITPNTTIAPDGTLTADTHTNTDTVQNGSYIRYVGAFTTDNTVYCGSVFFKRGTQSQSRIVMYSKLGATHNTTIVYNHDTDTISITNAGSVTGVLAGRIKYPNGWVRVWASFNCLAGTEVAGFNVIPAMWGIPASIGAEFGYVWGAQLEEGSYPTSYIPTTTAQVARPADVNRHALLITNANAGSFYAEVKLLGAPANNLWTEVIRLCNSVPSSTIGVGLQFDDNTLRLIVRDSGTSPPYIPSLPANPVVLNKIACTFDYTSGKAAVALNGVTWTTELVATGSLSPYVSHLYVGDNGTVAGGNRSPSSQQIKRCCYFPQALSAAELQAITTT